MTWTIQASTWDAPQTFSALGLTNLRRTLVSQSIDKVTFEGPCHDFTGDALFPYKTTCVIFRDNVRWFTGLLTSIPRQGSAQDERIAYELSGPWYYLEKIVYQQAWQMHTGAGGSLGSHNKSRIILNQSTGGARLNSGLQITDALLYARSLFETPPLAIGTIDPAVQIPWEEVRDITCAEVLRKQLRWSPDCVTWFDYTAEVPVLHVRKLSNLTPVSVEIPGSAGVPPATSLQSVAITPRYDLQAPGVKIIFETNFETTTDDGDPITYESFTAETAGDHSAYDALQLTIALAGGGAKFLSQKIKTEEHPGDYSLDKTWWKNHCEFLRDAAVADFDLNAPSWRGTILNLPNVLLEGQVQDWMDKDVDEQVLGCMVTYRYTPPDGSAPVVVIKDKPLTVKLQATNAATKTYRKMDSLDVGEPAPVGLAAALYASLGVLHYDGSITLVQQELTGPVGLGNVLNLTGGRAEWATMAACVQEVEEIADSGTTVITFGPPKHLEVDDLIQVLRNFRSAAGAYKFGSRLSGKSTDDSDAVELSGPVPESIVQQGQEEFIKLMISKYTGATPTAQYDLDPDLITADYQVLTVEDVAGVKTVRPGWVRAHA